MMIVYYGTKPYLPLLACSLHLGLSHGAEGFFPAGLSSMRGAPFQVVGHDSDGNIICSLVHGRHAGLYRRVLEGAAAIFEVQARWVSVDSLLSPEHVGRTKLLSALLAKYLPEFLGTTGQQTVVETLARQIQRQREGQH